MTKYDYKNIMIVQGIHDTAVHATCLFIYCLFILYYYLFILLFIGSLGLLYDVLTPINRGVKIY